MAGQYQDVCLVGFTGYIGSGKSECAKILHELNQEWTPIGFADPVREGVLAIDPYVGLDGYGRLVRLSDVVRQFGWDIAKRKFPEVRRLLQKYGTEGGRAIHGWDCWIKIFRERASAIVSVGRRVAAFDVRFDNEAAAIHEMGGVVVRVDNPRVQRSSDHESERLIDLLPVDAVILNDGDFAHLRRTLEEKFCGAAVAA